MKTAPLTRTAASLDRFAEWTGRAVSWLALALVLVTFAVVVLRYLFNFGSIAMQESILYLHATLFLLGSAYTLKQDGHVRVDIFYREFGPRGKALVDLLGATFLLMPVCLFLLWISWDYVAAAWALFEGSRETGGLPFVYLLKTLMPVASLLLVLQGLSQILHSLGTLLAGGEDA